MLTRQRLIVIGAAFAVVAAAALATYLWSRPTTLTFVVGPTGSEPMKVATALSQALARERSSVRLRLVIADNPADAGVAIERQRADLAILRADVALPESVQAVAIWQRNPIILAAPAGEGIERWTDLPGKTVGVLGRGLGINTKLIETILREHGIQPQSVRIVEVLPWEVADQIRTQRINAVVTVGPPTARPIAEAIGGVVREARDGKISLVPVREADAMAERVAYLESADIVAGAFGSNPPRPMETYPTLAVSHFLVANRNISDNVIAELTQQLFSQRPQIGLQNPAALRIEPPETDRSASVAVHPGALAYLTGQQKTFLESYGELIYISIFLVSLFGSGLAGMAGVMGWGKRPAAPSLLPDIITLLRHVRAADDTDILDEVAARADDILIAMVDRENGADVNESQFTAVTLALEHLRAAIADRRRALAMEADYESEAPTD